MLQVQRGYTSLLASKAQRWEAALKALQDAISTLAHFHAALAAMPGAGPQQRTRAWFDNLQSQVLLCPAIYFTPWKHTSCPSPTDPELVDAADPWITGRSRSAA